MNEDEVNDRLRRELLLIERRYPKGALFRCGAQWRGRTEIGTIGSWHVD